MFSSKCMFLCLCYVMLGCHTSIVPFINKCKWNDRACLVKSTQSSLLTFGKGLPDFEIPPMDPLTLDPVVYKEGDLEIKFNDMTMTGASQCTIIDVERNLEESFLALTADCPVFIQGTYVASGNLFTKPFEGNGPFTVKTDKMHISIKVKLTTVDGEDGQKHWKIGKAEHTYKPIKKPVLEFKNIFNGDPEKAELAGAILTIMNEDSWTLVEEVGKPIVKGVIDKIIYYIQKFAFAVPASELEM